MEIADLFVPENSIGGSAVGTVSYSLACLVMQYFASCSENNHLMRVKCFWIMGLLIFTYINFKSILIVLNVV